MHGLVLDNPPAMACYWTEALTLKVLELIVAFIGDQNVILLECNFDVQSLLKKEIKNFELFVNAIVNFVFAGQSAAFIWKKLKYSRFHSNNLFFVRI